MKRTIQNGPSRLKAAWQALRGGPERVGDPRARLAALELDVRERDAEVAWLREEYRRLSSETERARATAAQEQLRVLAERLAPAMSQLATLQALAEAREDVRVLDVLQLVGRVEAVLAEAGCERVGSVGAEVPFDPSLHQCLNSTRVPRGAAVSVRFVGYRLGETMLLKAMVGCPGTKPEGAPQVRLEEMRP